MKKPGGSLPLNAIFPMAWQGSCTRVSHICRELCVAQLSARQCEQSHPGAQCSIGRTGDDNGTGLPMSLPAHHEGLTLGSWFHGWPLEMVTFTKAFPG